MALLAPAAAVEAPPISPGLHGLVASATVPTERSDRWELGYSFAPEGAADPEVWAPGCPKGPKSDFAPTDPPWDTWQPFVVETDLVCPSAGFAERDYVGRAMRQLEAITSPALEHEFWTGEALPDNQHLAAGAAVTVLGGGTAVALDLGVALLESWLGDQGGGGRGMIHAPVVAASLICWHASGVYEQGTRLVIATRGNVLVAGAGYPGTGPDGADPPTGQTWLYATGWVHVRLGDPQVIPEDFGEALDRRNNTVEYRAERSASAAFDPYIGPAAVLVELAA